MERMLRKRKDNSDYEIDRELTWKFAIEKNAEYQDRIKQLEEENKKLKEELSKKNMETRFDEKAENIYKSQKENILMWKIC